MYNALNIILFKNNHLYIIKYVKNNKKYNVKRFIKIVKVNTYCKITHLNNLFLNLTKITPVRVPETNKLNFFQN